MNRILAILIMTVSLMTANAQISRTFWGVTLGKSTRNEVRTMLVQKGYKIHTMPDESYAINGDNVYFGGASWTFISFSFVNGYLSQVWFQNNDIQSPIDVDKVYDKLEKNLSDKYTKYHLDIPSNEEGTKWCNFSDDKTLVVIAISQDKIRKYISLWYQDENLAQTKERLEYNEL